MSHPPPQIPGARSDSTVVRLGVTLGDPCGIGPEVLVRVLAQGILSGNEELAVLGGGEYLRSLARQIGLEVTLDHVVALPKGRIAGRILSLDRPALDAIPTPGVANPRLYPFIRESLRLGTRLALTGEIDALVTNAITKNALQCDEGHFPGQTQYVAHHAGREAAGPASGWFMAGEPVMAMMSDTLRVTLVTDHLPLRDVFAALTPERLREVFRVTHEAGRYFGLKRPRIGVCGLNPHAGEGGLLGAEDDAIIAPVIRELRESGMDLRGPFAGDTIANRALEGELDFAVAMFHDQGLGPIKAHAFGRAVNVTLGIPLLRTSVDHGTAYDIAPLFEADAGSFTEAVRLTASMVRHRRGTP